MAGFFLKKTEIQLSVKNFNSGFSKRLLCVFVDAVLGPHSITFSFPLQSFQCTAL